MDCRTAQQLLPYLDRGPQELEPDEVRTLEAHLAECAGCASAAQAERQLDAHLRRAVLAVPIPSGLQNRIMERLRLSRAVAIRRWVLAGCSAAAASLLIGFGVYLALIHRTDRLPPLDFPSLSESLSVARTADQVQDWLDSSDPRALWLPQELHDDWNFEKLAHKYIQHAQGQNFPTLVFQNDESQVKVYLVRGNQYNPSTLAPGPVPQDPQAPWLLGGDGTSSYSAVIVVERGDWKAFQATPRAR